MTDTPRTKDELLAIFADAQGPAQITPQDMRDLVVSGVQQDGLHDFTITETGLSVPVPGDGTQTFIPFSSPTVHWDPSNALQTSSHPSPDWWGMTIPAKAWALLDSGIWDVAVLGLWASNPGTEASVSPDVVDNRIAQVPAIDARFGDPAYDYYMPGQYAVNSDALPSTGGLPWGQFTTFKFRIPHAGAPWGIGWNAAQATGSPINITVLQVRAWKLAEVA